MSKAVLISIRPKWCQKIADGEKTIEVRKTRPRVATPFKCYIYCTLPKYPHEDYITTEHPLPQYYGGGKVIGEFVCDRIYCLVTRGPGESYHAEGEDEGATNLIARQSCLGLSDMHTYLKSKTGYGLHISQMKLYDTPKELIEFRRVCPNDLYCESCAMYRENKGTCGNKSLRFKRPPLSWCYVEEM